MARPKPYFIEPSDKHAVPTRTRYPNSNSSPSSSASSSLHHTSPQPTPDPIRTCLKTTTTAIRNPGQRGRQARPSKLTPSMHRAVCRFSRLVGAPNVVPAGFRDFRGWIARLAANDAFPVWDQLIATIASNVNCDIHAINALKEDVVREIVKCVVVPRPHESAKLVSTNAGRQASRPRCGTTLMLVFEKQLERVIYRLPQLVAEISSSSGSDEALDSYFGYGGRTSPVRQISNIAHMSDQKHPSKSDNLGERCAPTPFQALPSFRELTDSLQRNGSAVVQVLINENCSSPIGDER